MSRLKKSTFRDHIVWSLKNPKNKINLKAPKKPLSKPN